MEHAITNTIDKIIELKNKAHEYFLQGKSFNEVYIQGYADAYNEFIQTEVIKKQIPKRPIDDIEYPICPTCHKPLYYGCIDRYCADCGQRLAWSE